MKPTFASLEMKAISESYVLGGKVNMHALLQKAACSGFCAEDGSATPDHWSCPAVLVELYHYGISLLCW